VEPNQPRAIRGGMGVSGLLNIKPSFFDFYHPEQVSGNPRVSVYLGLQRPLVLAIIKFKDLLIVLMMSGEGVLETCIRKS